MASLPGNIKLCKIVSGSYWSKFSGAQLFDLEVVYFSAIPIQRKKNKLRCKSNAKGDLKYTLGFSLEHYHLEPSSEKN